MLYCIIKGFAQPRFVVGKQIVSTDLVLGFDIFYPESWV